LADFIPFIYFLFIGSVYQKNPVKRNKRIQFSDDKFEFDFEPKHLLLLNIFTHFL